MVYVAFFDCADEQNQKRTEFAVMVEALNKVDAEGHLIEFLHNQMDKLRMVRDISLTLLAEFHVMPKTGVLLFMHTPGTEKIDLLEQIKSGGMCYGPGLCCGLSSYLKERKHEYPA